MEACYSAEVVHTQYCNYHALISSPSYGNTTNECTPTAKGQQKNRQASQQQQQQHQPQSKNFPSSNIREEKSNNHPSTGTQKRDPENDARKEGKYQGATMNPTQQGDA
ncbi:hypothetical protein HDV00_000960 [Rhizophlyctis rosea]|nr:hypothetical protein HDV00_000960 [Rhizophlyctis rosea]